MSEACPPSVVACVGYRGSGKSSVSKLLAQALNWPCHEMDELLEARLGMTIQQCFAQHGESYFRDEESKLLRDLLDSAARPFVLSTGGGVIIRQENRDLLKSCFVVYLAADADTLYQRLRSDPSTATQRPSLTGLSMADEIRTLLATREPWYREVAQLTLDTKQRSPEGLVSHILESLDLQIRPIPKAS